jgi:chromosomal replication initiator protein
MSNVSDVKLKQVWAEALLDIKASVGDGAFKTWISNLDIAGIDDIVLKLVAPSNFIRDNVLSRFSNDIIKIMNSYGCQIRTISIDVYNKGVASVVINDDDTGKIGIKEYQDISILDKRFTFKNFVIGKPNEFAYAAALSISESEVPTFNPLFLYGGVGLGKTHLMHAIAWNTHHHFPKKKVIYLSAEKFMYLFIKSLRFKNAISFKEVFRTVDVLMIDDVQFIGGKDTTQEEFFHTFNELVDNNKQVILSADKSPSDLGGVEDRLKSRLGWGLVADIHPTTYELRLGILQSKTKQFKATVPDNVLEFLAVKITSNIRELEGALNRIIAHATLVGRRITLEVAQEVLKDILRTNEKLVTIDFIQKKVCEYYGVKLSDLTSARRHKAVTTARQIAMYLCKDLTSRSLPDIGKNFGGKDHSTVIHAIKKIKDLMANDKAFTADLEILKKSLQN